MQFPSIYKIVNKTDGKYYVGSSINPKRRWREHRRLLRLGKHVNDYLQNAWNKYGASSFEFQIIKSFPPTIPERELLTEEQSWLDIASHDTLAYNLTFVAESPNVFLSDYSKKKRSESLKKVIKTEEWKMKISQSHFGIRPSKKSRKKMSLAKRGKRQSEIQKELATESRRKDWIFVSPEGIRTEIHDLTRFCKENNLHTPNMHSVYSGLRTHHKKWRKYDVL